MPFLTDVHGPRSFHPLPIEVCENFIFANYGGAQGVDNDDGSSRFRIHNNLFYSADGFKMDYGGHDSKFYNNLVIVAPYDGQNCVNLGSFKPGHGHAYYNNTCVSGLSEYDIPSGCGSPACAGNENKPAPDMDKIGSVDQCNAAIVHFQSNR